mgnify:FL=1
MEGALFNPGFLGSHFLWWVGQIAPSENWRGNQESCRFEEPSDIPGWGFRYKVRIMGLHGKDEDEEGDSTTIPNDQLPWAQVMYPVTAGGGQGGAFTTPNLRQGNFVFGFFLDGQDQQVPVIMGVLGNNAKTEIPDLKSHIFAPMSGYANASEDPSNVLAREVTDPKSTATTESSGDAVNIKTSATEAVEKVLETKIALSTPFTTTNIEMKNIQTAMEQMSTEIADAQKALVDFTSSASVPMLELSKTVDEILESKAGEITKQMSSIMGRVEQYTTGQFGDQMRQMLALAPTSAGLDMRKFQLGGLSNLAGTFDGINSGLLGTVLGALKNAFKKKKNSSPPPSPTQPQLQGPGSEIVPPLPAEGYYTPTPMCATEEVVGEVLGSVLNEIMTGFDNAIAPAVTAAADESGEAGAKAAGSSPLSSITGLLGGGIGGLLGGGGLTSLLPGGLGNLLPGGLGGLKGMNFDIATAMSFVGDVSSLFGSAPIPSFSPNDVFTMASGGNGVPPIPSLQSITDMATSQLGNLEGLTGQLGNLEGVAGNLSGALSGDLNLTSIADSFSGDLNLSSITSNFDVPSLGNVFDSSQITQGLDLASSQFTTGFSQLQEGLPGALDEFNQDLEELT